MLWESIRPNNLSDIDTHQVVCKRLQRLANNIKGGGTFPNLIICGPPQSGKLTLARCFLSSIYGKDIYQVNQIEHSVRQNCSTYSVKIYKSKFHYETTFTGLQYADRCVLTSLLDLFFSTSDVVSNRHKILVIRNFEELTQPAQFSLRRRIETSCHSVRFIFISKSYNLIEPALTSRCLTIRCPRPSLSEIENRLLKVCESEKVETTPEMIQKAVGMSSRNVGKAFFYLTAMVECQSLDIIDPVNEAIRPLVDCIKSDTYDCVAVRKILSDLQLAHIPHNKIIWFLIDQIQVLVPCHQKLCDVVIFAAECDTIASKGKRTVIPLEKFVLYLYQQFKKQG